VRADRAFLLGASDSKTLAAKLAALRDRAAGAADIAGIPEETESAEGELRAAVVAAEPAELTGRIESLRQWLAEGEPQHLRIDRGAALGRAKQRPGIGFLFPGQGAPVTSDGGYLEELLPEAAVPYREAGDLSAGEVPARLVQLSVVTASVAGLRAMGALGIDADFGVGHSVGELTALHWARAIDEKDVLELARRRGEVMTEHASERGAMANIEAEEQVFSRIVDGAEVTVACFNSPRNRVISGTEEAVDTVVERAREQEGARAFRLRVVGAFHSPLMSEAAPVFERVLAEQAFGSLQRPVFSTISGNRIMEGDDVAELLSRQVTEPVLFMNAVRGAVDGADLMIEVGPGRMLSGLVSEFSPVPAIPIRVGHSSAQGLLTAVGAAWVLGADVQVDRLRAA
jgi:enediyne polyketide synthase